MSKDLYQQANEVFNEALGTGEFNKFCCKIGLEDWLIEIELFDKSDQQRLVDAWSVFEAANTVKHILMRHPDFQGLSSESFGSLGVELWEIYRTTPRSYEEFSKRLREVQQESSQLSAYNN